MAEGGDSGCGIINAWFVFVVPATALAGFWCAREQGWLLGAATGLVCAVAAAFATLLSCLFALGSHSVKCHNLVEHERLDLPCATHWVASAVPWVFVVPLVVLVLGVIFLRSRTRHALAITVLANIAWLFALAWPLFCLYAWELPSVLLAGETG